MTLHGRAGRPAMCWTVLSLETEAERARGKDPPTPNLPYPHTLPMEHHREALVRLADCPPSLPSDGALSRSSTPVPMM